MKTNKNSISLIKYGINYEGSITDAVKLPLKVIPNAFNEKDLLGGKKEFSLTGSSIVTFKGGKTVNEGKWGTIEEWHQIDGTSSGNPETFYEKRGRTSTSNLLPEACLQIAARQCLSEIGCESVVSEVRKILRHGRSVTFMMEPFIKFLSLHDALRYMYQASLSGPAFDLWFIQIFSQIILILQYLEENLGLNHRDLQGHNILISMIPTAKTIEIPSKSGKWLMSYEHEIKLVDFGFACKGYEMDAPADISVGDTFPPFEWCPKEGRDIYYILCYFYGQVEFRRSLTKGLLSQIQGWLFNHYKESNEGAEKVRESLELYGLSRLEWISFLINTSKYRCGGCSPLNILDWIAERWPEVLKKV